MTYAFVVGAAVIAAALFVWWRARSVARGARARESAVLTRLDPLGERVEQGLATVSDVAGFVTSAELRMPAYRMLRLFERLDLFPSEVMSLEAQAEGLLAYWLMHPNELGHAPARVEALEVHRIETRLGEAQFVTLKFLDSNGSTAWKLGIVGPFADEPYEPNVPAFSRFDDASSARPDDLVSWWMKSLGL